MFAERSPTVHQSRRSECSRPITPIPVQSGVLAGRAEKAVRDRYTSCLLMLRQHRIVQRAPRGAPSTKVAGHGASKIAPRQFSVKISATVKQRASLAHHAHSSAAAHLPHVLKLLQCGIAGDDHKTHTQPMSSLLMFKDTQQRCKPANTHKRQENKFASVARACGINGMRGIYGIMPHLEQHRH